MSRTVRSFYGVEVCFGAVWSSLATSVGFWGCLGPIQGLHWLARGTLHLSPNAQVARGRFGRSRQTPTALPGRCQGG
eukprot:8241363-Pyramimonas_sp.AAC.1